MTVNNFSLEQIAQHNTLEDAWVIIHGKVYDVTTYLDDHPGGRNVLTEVAGTDATDDFDYVDHSDDALRKMETFQVGILSGWAKTPKPTFAESLPASAKPTASKPTRSGPIFTWALVSVCGLILLGYGWQSTAAGIFSNSYGFWSGVAVALVATMTIGGAVVLSATKRFFDHGKGVFQYKPYYDQPSLP